MPDNHEVNKFGPDRSEVFQTPIERADIWISGIKKRISQIEELAEKDVSIDKTRAVRGFVANELFGDSFDPLLRAIASFKSPALTEDQRRMSTDQFMETYIRLSVSSSELGNFLPRYFKKLLKNKSTQIGKFVSKIIEGKESNRRIIHEGEKILEIRKDLKIFPVSNPLINDINYYLETIEKTSSD